MAYEYTSGLGVRKTYGPYEDSDDGTCVATFGVVKQMLWPVGFDNAPEGEPDLTGRYLTEEAAARDPEGDSVVKTIPAHSFIQSAKIYVKQAFTSGTSFGLGLNDADDNGDDDGLVADLANADVGWVVGSGAQVGTDIGPEDLYLSSVVTGTYDGGSGILVVEYVEVPVV